MKKSLIYTILSVFVLLATSCSKADEPQFVIPDDASYDIVTVETINKEFTVFTYQKDGDSPLITLKSSTSIYDNKQGVKEGSRVLICYTPLKGAEASKDDIDLIYIRGLEGTKVLKGTASDFSNFESDAFDMRKIWRSGTYINMMINSFYYNEPKKFFLAVDESTINDEYPVLYVIYETDDPIKDMGRVAYGSFDIKEIWDMPTCKGVEVKYNNKNYLDRSIKFSKAIPDAPTPF